MGYLSIIIIKTIAIVTFSFLLFFYFRLKRQKKHSASRLLTVIMLVGGIAFWLNLGLFRPSGTFIHKTEHFHYFLGSKYFPELKYDGLYLAAVHANQERDPNYTAPLQVRDLRTNRVDMTVNLLDHQQEIRNRFTDARWEQFKNDYSAFNLSDTVFLDHGYNPPPPHTFMTRLFTSWLPVNDITMLLLGLIDIILIIGMSILVVCFFNIERAAIFTIILGIGFLYYFGWNGGALLRFDWLFALVLSVCFLHKKKPLFAGMSFAYAVAVRIFPVVLIAGLGVYWLRKKNFKNMRLYAIGFAAILIVMLILGSFAGTGLSAYTDSYDNFKNFKIWTTGVGMRYLLITSLDNLTGKTVDPYSLHLTDSTGDDYAKTQSDRIVLVIILTLAATALVCLAAAYAYTPVEAFIMGLGILFAAVPLGTYYWVILVLVVFFRPKIAVVASLAANFLMFAWFFCALLLVLFGAVPYFYVSLGFFPASIILCMFFIVWYGRRFLRNTPGPLKRLFFRK
ncbi:MAG: hypothetical protein JW904_04810 [Spirochaetales bacterium]|nr:hypothetical protein [Spirochaetales bacterium]